MSSCHPIKNGASAFIKNWSYPVQSAMIRSSQLSQLMTESLRWTDTLWSVIVTLGNAVSDQYRWNVLLNGNRVLPRGSAMSCNHVCLIPVMPWSTYECINSPYRSGSVTRRVHHWGYEHALGRSNRSAWAASFQYFQLTELVTEQLWTKVNDTGQSGRLEPVTWPERVSRDWR